MSVRVHNEAEIAALLIAPDRALAQQFLATLPQTRAFQILADLKSYPPHQTLDIRARQLRPNIILLDLATDLTDFGETAALIENLDLVITVDTSMGHLAGALGKPVWIMIPKAADWRRCHRRQRTPQPVKLVGSLGRRP